MQKYSNVTVEATAESSQGLVSLLPWPSEDTLESGDEFVFGISLQ